MSDTSYSLSSYNSIFDVLVFYRDINGIHICFHGIGRLDRNDFKQSIFIDPPDTSLLNPADLIYSANLTEQVFE